MGPLPRPRRWYAAPVALAVAALLAAGASPATADPGGLAIGHVQPDGDGVQILVSVPEGVRADDLSVSIGGVDAPATGERAGESEEKVRRTTILAIDTSNSMKQHGRFEAAKKAATTFLANAPEDVFVGILTFDSDVETALDPTLDRDVAKSVVADLGLARETLLNDGVISAIDVAGEEGQRAVLVLSDGRDTSDTPTSAVIDAVEDAGVGVDVVALDQRGDDLLPLEALAEAGNGAVVPADPDSLTAAFDEEAASLSRQVLLTAQVPAGVTGDESTVEVTSGGHSTSSHVIIRDGSSATPTVPAAAPAGSGSVTRPMMYGGLALLGIGLLVLLGALVTNGSRPRKGPSVETRIGAYSFDSPRAGTAGPKGRGGVELGQAKEAAASILERNKGLEERIGQRLIAGGSSLKPAEWVLVHGGTMFGAGMVGLLLGKGDVLFLLLFLALGMVLPWLWLGRQRTQRLSAFNAQLADTLQLVSGSLSAGMSLAQAIDTVVKEGRQPVAGEFRQALMQSRLGVPLVDALEDVAARTESKDFAWVVMAIRIQQQVGGNLTELLTTVAATLRERDYLRRQVSTLSAEGRLSGWILGALPVLVGIYLLLVRRDYIRPLYTEPLGIVMLLAAMALLGLGAWVISRLVKVEV